MKQRNLARCVRGDCRQVPSSTKIGRKSKQLVVDVAHLCTEGVTSNTSRLVRAD